MKPLLLVEDTDTDVFLFKRAMTKAGVNVPLQVVEDGRQALDYLGGTGQFQDRERFPLPSVILLDLKLPYIMGLDVLKWIRSQEALATLPVIILTSSNQEMDIDQAYRLRANSYLVKPGDSNRLLELVKQVNDYWLHLNHPPPFPRPNYQTSAA